MRRIRLSFPDSGEFVLADLLDEEAPEVCRVIWDLLPVEGTAIHGMYSGAEIFTLIENPPPAPPQNMTQIPVPGELFYFFEPGGNVTSRQGGVGEICFVYGRGVVLRGPEGAPTHASLFARVPGDWKHDWVRFAQACRKVRWEGPRRLLLQRA